MERPLLIGQAPGPNTDPDLPLFPVPNTSAGGRLQQMTGLTRGRYLATFDRVNLLPEFPGRHKRDDKFPLGQAKFAARVMSPLLAGRTVVMVGRNVANAFGVDLGFLDWGEIRVRRPSSVIHCKGTALVAVIPHPSGRNHWYNDEKNRAQCRDFWSRFLNSVTPR